MRFNFEDVEVQERYNKFLDKIMPRMKDILAFCEQGTEDNLSVLKKRLLDYEAHNNFLSFHYSEAMGFYKLALAQEWAKEPDFKGIFERKVRATVEARAIEPEAVLERFERLIKGLSVSLTAVQTNLRVEESLLARRME